MDLSPYNIQRITRWIQSEVDYTCFNPGYTIALQDEKVLLEQSDKELEQVLPSLLNSSKISIVCQIRTPHMSSMSQNISKT